MARGTRTSAAAARGRPSGSTSPARSSASKEAFTQPLPVAMRVKLPGRQRSRLLLTTTPKCEYAEPFHILKDLVAKDGNGRVVVTRGTTWENVDNIRPKTSRSGRRTSRSG